MARILVAIFFCPLILFGQNILSGIVRGKSAGVLPSAHILVQPDSVYLATGDNGRFEKKLPVGVKTIRVSYVGFEPHFQTFYFSSDTSIIIELSPEAHQLQEVTITTGRYS